MTSNIVPGPLSAQVVLVVTCPECDADYLSTLTTTEIARSPDGRDVPMVRLDAFAEMDVECECGVHFATPGMDGLTARLPY